MENSKQSIIAAEKRVGEMNKLTQGLLEQSNRYFQQKNAPHGNIPQNSQPNVPNRNTRPQNEPPNTRSAPRQNVPFQNNGRPVGQPQKPRFEPMGNARQRKPQTFAPPPAPPPDFSPEPPKHPQVQKHPQVLFSGEPKALLPIKLDSDTILIAALAAVLVREKADTKLILALLYILM